MRFGCIGRAIVRCGGVPSWNPIVSNREKCTITPGAIHRGKIFHVQFKPLYEAIGEPDNRHRRAASLGRFVERLMLLDAVLADTRHTWLGTEHDKLAYFRAAIDMHLPDDFYPHVTYGHGADTTTRFFPEKLPIGVPRAGHRRHVFVYLATREVPMDFRVFLLRHADLLPRVDEWTIRVLVPRRLKKAVALYRYAVRDAFMMPVTPHDVEELDWYFRGRRGDVVCPSQDPRLDLPTAAKKFGAARFDALYREWLRRDWRAFWAAQSTLVRDQLHAATGASNSSNSRTSTCSSHRSPGPCRGPRRPKRRSTT
jgi:hypothetical protein